MGGVGPPAAHDTKAPRLQVHLGFAMVLVVVTFVVGLVVGTMINAGHQPEIIHAKAVAAVKAVAVEKKARTMGKQNIPARLAAETTFRTSKTAGALDHTSPPAVGVYEPGGRRVEWTSSSSPLPCNILFVKVHKCASSTTSGIARRIAAHHGISGVAATCPESRLIQTPEPAVSANHGALAPRWKAMQELTMRTFLWTMIRLPVSRCMSGYYFMLTFNAREKTNRQDVPQNSLTGKIKALSGRHNDAFNYVKRHDSDTPESLVPIP